MHRRQLSARWLGALLVLTAFALTLPPAAHAMTLTVTDSGDSGPNTLRGKIASASSGDTIVFDLPSCPCVITLTSATLTIDKDLTITGPGVGSLAIDGNATNRVLTINSGTVNISNLTIRHGNADNGGNVNIQGGTVTLDHVVVSGGTASLAAGGIYNLGTLVMTNSTLSGNSGFLSAGLYNDGPSVTLTGVTISGNQATSLPGAESAGLRTDNGTTTLTNVTVTGNSANAGGAGMTDNGGILNLINTTVANNTTSGNGGGIWAAIGTPNITNTIIAGNTAPMGGPDCYGTLTSHGYNLIQNTAGCTISGDTTGNLTGSNPHLGALADNGGPTQTMALGASSPAINAANPAVCAAAVGLPTLGAGGLDQRGFSRRTTSTPQFCDIGAFEAQAASNTATSGSGQTTKTNTAFALPLKVTVKDASANTLGGAVVSFAGPGSGASIVSGTATTNSSGEASFLPTANSLAGTYMVTGTVSSVTASFTLTNTGQLFLPVVLK